jgi:hypothetical protein
MSDMEVDTRILVPMHNGLLCMPRYTSLESLWEDIMLRMTDPSSFLQSDWQHGFLEGLGACSYEPGCTDITGKYHGIQGGL